MSRFNDYLNDVQFAIRANPDWRVGQAFYNVLHAFEPKLVPFVTGSEIDPYNDDHKIPIFLEKLSDYWSKNE